MAGLYASPKTAWKWRAAGEARLLIQINTAVVVGTETIQTVNARELHGFLGVRKVFGTWITDRIAKYGVQDGVDFTTVDFPDRGNQTGRGGDRRPKDYHVSLDMAKELAMVERNEQGRKAAIPPDWGKLRAGN